MRTTVTLDPDTEALIRRRMREQGVSFKVALNDAIRASSPKTAAAHPFSTEAAYLGRARLPLDRALQLAGELENDELIRKARAGK